MLVQRWGVFRQDGTGVTALTYSFPGPATLLTPAPLAINGEQMYFVALDDTPEHWARLYHETAPHKLKHKNGSRHHEHAHIKLQGDLSWQSKADAETQKKVDHFLSLSTKDLIVHLTGHKFPEESLSPSGDLPDHSI